MTLDQLKAEALKQELVDFAWFVLTFTVTIMICIMACRLYLNREENDFQRVNSGVSSASASSFAPMKLFSIQMMDTERSNHYHRG